MHFKVSFKSSLVLYFLLATTLMTSNPFSGINVSTVTNDDDDSLIDNLGLLSFTDNTTPSTATASRLFLANVGSLFRPSKSPTSPSMVPVYSKSAHTPDIPPSSTRTMYVKPQSLLAPTFASLRRPPAPAPAPVKSTALFGGTHRSRNITFAPPVNFPATPPEPTRTSNNEAHSRKGITDHAIDCDKLLLPPHEEVHFGMPPASPSPFATPQANVFPLAIPSVPAPSAPPSIPVFSVPFRIAAASDHPSSLSSIEYIANVSFVNFLALILCINFLLSPPSYRSQEDPSLPLITLMRRLSKLFLLLVYNSFPSRYDNMPTADAAPPKDVDGDSVNTTGLGFDKIDGIFIRFGPHWKNLAVNKLLNIAYSQNLPDLDELFSDGSSRTQLKPTAIKLIRKQLVEFVSIRATTTPDKTKIAPIINELFFKTKSPRGVSFPVQTVQELVDSLTAAVALVVVQIYHHTYRTYIRSSYVCID